MNEQLLLSILSTPSAPFREGRVISEIRAALDQAKVPYFSDPIGNLVLGVRSQKEYLALIRKKDSEPIRVFIAHMDHPGFHGAHWKSPTQLEIKWHGGSPTQHLEQAKVWLADAGGYIGHAKILSAQLTTTGRAIESGVLEVSPQLQTHYPDPTQIYGGFGFRDPVWKEGELLYTKAADDLVGSFAIVAMAIELFSKRGPKKAPPFIGLLTRAEEVGFIGAIGHFGLGWLKQAKRKVLCISLETSRTLPGAEIGKGPVVRLGDRTSVFDAAALHVLSGLACKILPEKHQRRIMDGGSCEATAATAYGFSCVGISVPLGNYHNQSFEGGPDSAGPMGPAPEFVHLQDVAGLLELCRGLLKPKLPWNEPWKPLLKEFKRKFRDYRPLLRSGLL
ncbi:hypothetical protein WDW37_13875 [Bdellovibrionota bacterium FG-1]